MKTAKKSIAILLALIMSITCFSLIGFAEETETQEHLTEVPEGYVGIYTKDDLDNIKLNMAGSYILMNDIVFEDSDYEKGGSFYNSGKGWEPIGTSSTKFTGTFDGNGYSIKNLYINNPEQSCIGLFGYTLGSTIKNLTFNDLSINGKNYVGSVVGYVYNTLISNITLSKGIVIGNDYVGGIAGYISSTTITNCNYSGEITGKNYIGGIAGWSVLESKIDLCNVQGVIVGEDYVGGVVGYQYSSYMLCESSYDSSFVYNYLQRCNNASKVSGRSYVGGITGCSKSYYEYDNYDDRGHYYVDYNGFSYVINCSNSGKVSASSRYAGGIVGFSTVVGEKNPQYIRYCYNSGDVTSSSYIGGIVGCCNLNYTSVNHCYSVGLVSATSPETLCYFGGLFGTTPCSESFCYYLEESVVNPTCTSGTAKSEDQMRKQTTYEQWDFINTWTMGGREDYPYPELVDVPLFLPEDYVHSHNYSSEITKEATHIETGIMTYTCECGDAYTEEIAKKIEHTYNSVTTAPTCIDQGYTTYTCKCGDTYVDNYINAIGHKYEAVITTPTCTEQGYTTFTCACGYSYVGNYVNSTGHNYNAVVTAPTCTEQGYTTYTCTCGDTYTGSYVTARGHIYTSVTTAPTCTEKGFTTYTCECGDTYVANYVNATGHTYTSEVTTPATHLETGIMTYTCECGDSYTEEIAKTTEHTYNEVITAPTCIHRGYTTYTCECGDTYKDDYVDATGHDFTDWTVSREVTCTVAGEEYRYCNNCGDEEYRYPDALGHSYEAIVTAPTCTENGYTTYSCDCGDNYVSDYVDSLGHDYVNGSCTACDEADPDYVPETPDEPEYDFSFSIQTPSRTTIRYKDGIVLHANVDGNLPDGAFIKWTADNNNFDTEKASDGMSMTITSKNNGDTNIYAIVYNADGEIIACDSITMTSKAGFFDKVGGFFRDLFSTTKIYES